MKYDYLVVGCGLYGAVFARQAKDKGKKVLIIEKRNHIAGNIYTEKIEGINVHKYGPHIFHTNNEDVWNYVNKFIKFNRFTFSPIAIYKDDIYPLPFNMFTFNKIWGCITPKEAKKIIDKQKKEIKSKPKNLEEQAISLVGKDIFNKLIKGYTEKQWGRNCKELPPFIIKRLPVRFSYDSNYYNALYQGIPIGGYTKLVQNMLKEIKVKLNEDYLKNKKYYDSISNKIIYTGAIDEYFNYKLGNLEYRTVYFKEEILNTHNFQGCAMVNYTDKKIPWTRIIEHKWFEFGKDEKGKELPKTVITKEFSKEWNKGNEPYYPVNDEKNNLLYNQYTKLAKKEKNIFFGGRLGEYKYYDMDMVIDAALKFSKLELK